MDRIKCFVITRVEKQRISLRRYTMHLTGDMHPCTKGGGYHSALTFLGDEPTERDEEGYIANGARLREPKDHPRWPTQCASCDYVFQDYDVWQRFSEELFCREETGEIMTIRQAPAGAMSEAAWLDQFQIPQGEHNLVVKTPGGEWCIDSQSSNCGQPEDHQQKFHHCWIRHGIAPNITVSKEGGPTCSAGAGSIQCGSYHGFLRDGWLEG